MTEWRPIAGYEGLYEVSTGGQVRSLPRKHCRGRVLKPSVFRYQRVFLSRNAEETWFYVHHLVAAAFLGPCPDGMEICHGPGGITDNSVDNLYYGTHVQNNVDDKIRDGTFICGSRTYNAKLSEEKVMDILVALKNGVSCAELSARYGVSRRNIRLIREGRAWKHVPR